MPEEVRRVCERERKNKLLPLQNEEHQQQQITDGREQKKQQCFECVMRKGMRSNLSVVYAIIEITLCQCKKFVCECKCIHKIGKLIKIQ